MSLSIHTILCVTSEELATIKKWYGKSQEDINDDIEHLRTWMVKQPHLPQNLDDMYLEKLLRMNKFSLEKCKKKIDMYFSVKNIIPEFFYPRDLLGPELKTHMDNIMICPLPKLTKDYSRVNVFQFITKDAEYFELVNHAKYIFALADLRFRYDDCITDIYICDMSNCTMGYVLKQNLAMLKKGLTIIEKAYSDRIQSVHFFNLPNCANILVNFAKTLFNEKMTQRVIVHKDLDSLHRAIPKSTLPKEYGGTEKSIVELNANWRKILEENNKWLDEVARQASNEKLRIGKPLNDADIFGSIHGSFRQLSVD